MRSSRDSEDISLLRDKESDDFTTSSCSDKEDFTDRARMRSWRLELNFSNFTAVSILLNVLLLLLVTHQRRVISQIPQSRLPPWPMDVFSPADEVTSYETIVFEDDVRNHTIYAEYSDEADAAWTSLYEDLIILGMPTEDAKLLPNPTSPHPDRPEISIVGLDVFHELHCLNYIRMSFKPERYNLSMHFEETSDLAASHLLHCVDSIRQSLMCSADTSTIYWLWSEDHQLTQPRGRNTHTCRRWDDIISWSKEHALGDNVSLHKHADGAPVV